MYDPRGARVANLLIRGIRAVFTFLMAVGLSMMAISRNRLDLKTMSAPGSTVGPRPTVSAIVVCFNEEQNIGDCLESLSWCDEIVVVDSFSTDRTVEICRQYTDRIIRRPWAGYRDQKAFAHSQATKDWVLLVDSDERVTPKLRDEIRQTLGHETSECAGFAVPRLVFYLG